MLIDLSSYLQSVNHSIVYKSIVYYIISIMPVSTHADIESGARVELDDLRSQPCLSVVHLNTGPDYLLS